MSGDAVIAVAIWTIFWKHEYISLLATPWYFLITYGLLLSGLLAVSAAIWGCCSIWREARPMICGVSIHISTLMGIYNLHMNQSHVFFFFAQYSFLLIVVFALQFSVGGFAYIYETQIDDELLNTLNRTFINRYGIDETQTIAIDSMQQKASDRDADKCDTYFLFSFTDINSPFKICIFFCSSNAVVPYDSRNGAKVSGWTQPAWTIRFDRMLNASCPIRVVSLIA